MNRRAFLRIALASASASFIDYEKLLWIPGEKTIFLPTSRQVKIFESDIIALEWEGLMKDHSLKSLFERNNMFYKAIGTPGKFISGDRITVSLYKK